MDDQIKIISVHLPKSAGTSLAAGLEKTFGERLHVDNTDDPVNPLSQRVQNPKIYFNRARKVDENIACLHGHFHPGQFDLNDVFLLTVLRHPIDNILSIYYFWKSSPPHGNPLHDYFIANRLSLIDFANLPAIRHLYNETYFGGFDMNRFNILGRYEDRAGFFYKIKDSIGLELDQSICKNVTPMHPERLEDLHNMALLNSLRDILKCDIDFYEKWAF